MKVIYTAEVVPVGGGYCLKDPVKEDKSEYWDGNIHQYVFDKLDYGYACSSVDAEYDGTIYDLPQKAVVLSLNWVPRIAYWCEEEQ